MASVASVCLSALVAVAMWTGVGWAIGRRLGLPAVLVLPVAPTLGWAVQTVASLTAASVFGLDGWTVLLPVVALLLLAALPSRRIPARQKVLGAWTYLAVAVLAAVPAAAILPKVTAEGVFLAAPIFDHAMIALVDEIVRDGVPPGNPVFGQGGTAGAVAYPYLWHFGAAQLALLTGASGWEADAAATWFTAFASLLLICGLARHLYGAWWTSLFVLILSVGGSLRPVIGLLIGAPQMAAWLEPPTGFASWAFQASWSPHNVQSAACVLIAVLLMVRLAVRPALGPSLGLAFVLAAGAESSLWIGGVGAVLSGTIVAALLIARMDGRRLGFVLACGGAALCAAALASPFLSDFVHRAGVARDAFPIGLHLFPVLGPGVPDTVRRVLDPPAYWLIQLVLEFPAIALPGGYFLIRMLRRARGERALLLTALAGLAGASLFGGWVLASTAGQNNDLGWRIVLPGIFVLTACSAAGVARALTRGGPAPVAVVLVLAMFALPAGTQLAASNLTGRANPQAFAFTQAPEVWAAVRAHTPVDARVASNPRAFAEMTPWPINISWALMADRRSCFAGIEMARALAPLSPVRRTELSAQFDRVFSGEGGPADISELRFLYGCRVVVVTPADGAWTRDPFRASLLYRLVDERADAWRIYQAR
ncbi:hypothetical protein [Aquabacter spiritensis]|uniref:4-amino-4-deoxy-L-arabinose transferase-like glycosyltransferase n=1 Tax=Aquabacter spiritensis TaxID=933073 RepID=A0A4R3LUJ8_9HYPH|nr:hypothetical protein [Aquabacter spiritensis]TCT04280.1 hypothetical protein EDC64_10796 [Aquabacter spiritensis]